MWTTTPIFAVCAPSFALDARAHRAYNVLILVLLVKRPTCAQDALREHVFCAEITKTHLKKNVASIFVKRVRCQWTLRKKMFQTKKKLTMRRGLSNEPRQVLNSEFLFFGTLKCHFGNVFWVRDWLFFFFPLTFLRGYPNSYAVCHIFVRRRQAILTWNKIRFTWFTHAVLAAARNIFGWQCMHFCRARDTNITIQNQLVARSALPIDAFGTYVFETKLALYNASYTQVFITQSTWSFTFRTR